MLSSSAWAVFTHEQVVTLTVDDYIYGHIRPESVARLFYHFFDAKQDPTAAPQAPKWLKDALPAMRSRVVWKDSKKGRPREWTEVQLWQEPAAALYDFFVLTKKVLPKSKGGQSVKPRTLTDDYERVRARYDDAVNRLYFARRGTSLGGRGADVMIAFRRGMPAMRAVNSALLAGDDEGYADAVMDVAASAREAYDILTGPAPKR